MRTRATAVVVKDGKLLMIHRHKHGEEYWVLPGGKVDEGETSEQAVIRELDEETSILGEVEKEIFNFTDHGDDRHVLFSVKYVSGEPMLRADSEEANSPDPEQSYSPEWVETDRIPTLPIYMEEEKEFLLKYLK